MRSMLAAGALILCAVPVQAQTPDTRWSTWMGCWELVTEDVPPAPAAGDPLVAPNADDPLVAPNADDPPPRICVTPAGDGARFETTVPGQAPVEYTIVPNGSD